MAANLDTSLGFIALAFTGSRSAIWHKGGNSIDQEEANIGRKLTAEELWKLAGCDYTVVKRPLLYTTPESGDVTFAFPDRFAHIRADTGAPVGMGSTRYKLVQPSDIRDTFQAIIGTRDDLTMTTVGALDGGKRIWGQAEFAGDYTVAGDKHKRHLLLSTTFDTSGASIGKMCATRVVCENTFNGSMGEHTPTLNIRHSTSWNADQVRRELAAIAQGFEQYKALGDKLAQHTMSPDELRFFIRDALDIPVDAKPDDVSTRKKNQRQAIIDALLVSANERNQAVKTMDAFTAFQGLTRYVDHERDVDDTEGRLFGSGAGLKDKALSFLMAMPALAEKVAA